MVWRWRFRVLAVHFPKLVYQVNRYYFDYQVQFKLVISNTVSSENYTKTLFQMISFECIILNPDFIFVFFLVLGLNIKLILYAAYNAYYVHHKNQHSNVQRNSGDVR